MRDEGLAEDKTLNQIEKRPKKDFIRLRKMQDMTYMDLAKILYLRIERDFIGISRERVMGSLILARGYRERSHKVYRAQ